MMLISLVDHHKIVLLSPSPTPPHTHAYINTCAQMHQPRLFWGYSDLRNIYEDFQMKQRKPGLLTVLACLVIVSLCLSCHCQ